MSGRRRIKFRHSDALEPDRKGVERYQHVVIHRLCSEDGGSDALERYRSGLGPDHPDVAQGLENYAALLRETDRADEAAKMEARAKAIRAKYE